jgi:hypothetical protein
MVNPQTPREQRIMRMTQLYYSRPDIKKAIFDFSKDREVVPSYMMEGFGKRPDTLQYPGDIFELVKRGATSFHCSEELWEDPLKISIDMNEKQMNELRKGWDLLIDIDSKYLDYSKIMVQQTIKVFKFHNIKNFGIKFSGSKGFHIIIPWKAFPKEINEIKTSDMFPEWPRIITRYITEITEKELIEKTSSLAKPSKYVRDFQVPKEVMPDLILVSPRHLFRMPYSLHEKTALASVVLEPEEVENFQPRDADPLKAKPRDFIPDSEEGEAAELLREALDWYKNKYPEEEKEKREFDFKPVKLTDLSEKYFPSSIQKILQGIKGDGRKRALFVLMNLFRSIGMEKEELEKRIYAWNEKNEVPLKTGYIKSQLISSYRKKPILPPNYDKDYYKGIGVAPTEEEIRYKNPVSYIIKKSFQEKRRKKPKKSKKDSHEDTFHIKNK